MALRALVLILVVATFFAAGGERMQAHRRGVRLARRGGAGEFPHRRLGHAAGLYRPAAGDPAGPAPGRDRAARRAPVAVPAGSQLVVRATGNVRLDVARKGGLEDAPGRGARSRCRRAPRSAASSSRATAPRRCAASAAAISTWTFTAIPDRAPTIALTKEPERQARGSLLLDYKLEDDYGVVDAQATFALKDEPSDRRQAAASAVRRAGIRAGAAAGAHPQRRRRRPPRISPSIPGPAPRSTMTLVARDEAGNEGRSEPIEFDAAGAHLRQAAGARADRAAPHPRARRRRASRCVLTALDALTIAPEQFTPETASISACARSTCDLAQRQERRRAARRGGAAVGDGGAARGRQRLARPSRRCAQAQEALRQALERGASDEEIKKLTDELRAALDKFLQALAEEMRKNPQQLARPLDPQYAHAAASRICKSMLDRLEQLARSGDKDAARQLLDRTAVDAGEPADGAAGRSRATRATTT